MAISEDGSLVTGGFDAPGHERGQVVVYDRGHGVPGVRGHTYYGFVSVPVVLLNPIRDYKHYAEGPATRVEWTLGDDLIVASVHWIHDERDRSKFFRHMKPVAMAGYSIYIYHAESDDANRFRKELRHPEMIVR